MAHDFKRFPELTNSQMDFYYDDSPHPQITEDISVRVVKVTDGDTIRVEWNERDFDFPVRFIDTAAPELDESGGEESQRWLEQQIMGEDVDLLISSNRVDKWGRLLARIFFGGLDINEDSIRTGHAVSWENRKENSLPDFDKELEAHAI